MDTEYYAMRLMLSALGSSDIPECMKDVVLSDEDEALSSEEKFLRSSKMLHDEEYYDHKSLIRDHLSQCVEELKSVTFATRDKMQNRMHVDLVWLIIMVALETVFVLIMLWLMTTLGINPIIQAVEHIKQDQSLPIVGANEFRYLANTYNVMYSAYKRSIENLSFKASHDELTGAYNRAGYDLIKSSFDLSTTAILLFDADKFKSINDNFGHEVGDKVLQKIAKVLKANFRSDDYVCRIGGDEFVVMMVHVDESVRHMIENKVTQINRELEKTEDGTPAISLSAGVSLCHRNNDSQEMFHEADIALYHVKDNGRRGCCFYEPGMRQKKLNP
ncbi:MAG: GGDEF domain-containing protein [Oscillospiraceae bacterium]|nr:GGDEF domain-containing protein [Oscillospiraceae bacterium]